MALKINVTWPRHLPQICIPFDCSDLESISRKATKSGDDIVIDGAFGQGNRVCDDDRYRIDRRSNDPLECCERDAAFEQTLVIVLESPRKEEYLGNRIDRPIAPAVGRTGHNIRNHLMDVIRSCSHIHCRLVQETRVIIANPIQFQCSLESVIKSDANPDAWKKIRDAVWKALWNRKDIRKEFKKRLRRHNPDFIINACTHDLECTNTYRRNNGNECRMQCRKRKIRDFLKQKFPCAHIYTAAAHPTTWHKNDRRCLDLLQERRQNQHGPSAGANEGQE